MTTMEFLTTGRPESDYRESSGYRYANHRPRTECVDGFSVSVQAGEFLYSSPRSDAGPWTAAELGFPDARPEPWSEWESYAEEADRPTHTVYSYVPIAMIEALIALHGGEK